MLLLRRVRNELRELRWGQVLVELVLLIVGILIALAVNGWIEDRRDARTEHQNLELLMRDLDSDLEVLAEVTAFEEKQTANGLLAYRALRGGHEPADREAVSRGLSDLMSRRTLRLTRATYTNLISTGGVRFIRNAALRDRIIKLYEQNERELMIHDRNNMVFVDQMFAQYLLDSGLIAPRPSDPQPGAGATSREFAEQVAILVDQRNDRLWNLDRDSNEWAILTNKVWYRGSLSHYSARQLKGMAAETQTVRQSITEELARRWPDARIAAPADRGTLP